MNETRHKRRYWRRKNAGLCTSCGQNPPSNNKSWCLNCLKKGKTDRYNMRQRRISQNICTWNGCKNKSLIDHKYCSEHLTKHNENSSKRAEITKIECFNAYGGVRCSCCGETELWVLCLDHINNDGATQRRQLKKMSIQNGGGGYYTYLKSLGFPNKDQFRVLCANCNLSIYTNNGICHHRKII